MGSIAILPLAFWALWEPQQHWYDLLLIITAACPDRQCLFSAMLIETGYVNHEQMEQV